MKPTTTAPRSPTRFFAGVAGAVLLAGTAVALTASSASAAAAQPYGRLDAASLSTDGTTLNIWGWTIDSQTPTTSISADIYLDGTYVTGTPASLERDDIAAIYPSAGADHGYAVSIPAPTTAGTHYLCAYGINSNDVGPNPLLGCRKVLIAATTVTTATAADTAATTSTLPMGYIDSAAFSADGSTYTIAGWAFDAKTPTAPIGVDIYVDGAYTTTTTASAARDDVAAVYPAEGANHGYTATFTAPTTAGTHYVCAYALNANDVGPNTLIGCRKAVVGATAVTSSVLPGGYIDTIGISADGSTLTMSGWTIDLKSPTTSIDAHLYLDGQFVTAVTASDNRTDVGAAYPSAGSAHGYTFNVAAPAAGSGTHYACVYAINTDGAATNPLLGCRTFTV